MQIKTNKQTNKQTNDSINILETSSRDELLKIENSNDCCTTQHPLWIHILKQLNVIEKKNIE